MVPKQPIDNSDGSATERQDIPQDDLAAEEGVDISMLRERLRLTPTERLERHKAALAFVIDLQDAAGSRHAQR